jgi:hypothetical protein
MLTLAGAWKGITATMGSRPNSRVSSFIGSAALLLVVGSYFCRPSRPTTVVRKLTTLRRQDRRDDCHEALAVPVPPTQRGGAVSA